MLSPDYYYDSIYMIPYNDLWQRGIRALIFDLDNTLAPYDTPRPQAKVIALIRRLKRIGFTVCLLTNNTKKRVDTYNEHLELIAIHGAMKPFASGINRAIKAMDAKREETAIIGDQLFSDIWGGRNAKILTILVKPVSKYDIPLVRWRRLPEKLLINAYLKKLKSEKK
ncbi:MAG: YqeG family HAD IIIA-type phosphatase [Clostridiales bacterium]|jgi:HAD superfamily phosphatase (TIGR01668 family)|nr:YqeG family HAD IIIA-type phosphatase [Clostridiales bacterium]